ncbi:hypothetical protein MTR67_030307 [Solanum verrucosum]|uniref:Uncharacterized protein n=1 Tax=Solanum verrucosum TaxID=315347 RepID=A0AAF0TXK2_SOLVR|nr:hypothetical protein MTR67_030307 [Solanum verrucosum]
MLLWTFTLFTIMLTPNRFMLFMFMVPTK